MNNQVAAMQWIDKQNENLEAKLNFVAENTTSNINDTTTTNGIV